MNEKGLMEQSNAAIKAALELYAADHGKLNDEVMNEDAYDEIFCQYLAGMLTLCAEVVRLNFSGFFSDASTLFGRLFKVRHAGSSNSTESSTTTE